MSGEKTLLVLACLCIPASGLSAWVCGNIHENNPLQLWFAFAGIVLFASALVMVGASQAGKALQ